MENITGQNNEFTLIFPHNRIDCTSSQNDKFNKIINQANITITGTTIVSQCISTLKKVRKNCCLATDFC